MGLEEEIKEINTNLIELKERPLSNTRFGLYTMVVISMFSSCSAMLESEEIKDYVKLPIHKEDRNYDGKTDLVLKNSDGSEIVMYQTEKDGKIIYNLDKP